MYLTISELETRAYLAGNTALSDALAQLDDSQLMVDQLEFDLDEAKSDSLERWERNNGPVKEYYDFFHECFDRLGSHYPCPSITSDYDKSVIFNAIEGNE